MTWNSSEAWNDGTVFRGTTYSSTDCAIISKLVQLESRPFVTGKYWSRVKESIQISVSLRFFAKQSTVEVITHTYAHSLGKVAYRLRGAKKDTCKSYPIKIRGYIWGKSCAGDTDLYHYFSFKARYLIHSAKKFTRSRTKYGTSQLFQTHPMLTGHSGWMSSSTSVAWSTAPAACLGDTMEWQKYLICHHILRSTRKVTRTFT